MVRRAAVNILFCESNVDGTIGGSYFSLLYLVKGLDRSRFRPTVVFYREHSLLGAFRDAGAETIVWPRGTSFSFGGRAPDAVRPAALALQKGMNLIRGFAAPTLARARFLRERAIRIVHLNNSILYNHDWMAAARLARTICVSHERGINDAYPGPARFFGRGLHAIVCISRAVHDNMRARGAAFPNLRTIHNGLDPGTMSLTTPPAELRARFGIGPTDPVVVMVGNLKEWKGQHTLVEALDRVRRAHPTVRCVLVGATAPSDQPYEARLRETVTRCGLGAHVIFAGFQRSVADFVMMGDVLVHASVLPEPFGRVILEGMACRKPIVGARGGAITELVAEGETGLTFSPGDPVSLAQAVGAILESVDTARRMGNAGFDRLVREFHIDRNVEATQRMYEELLHGC